MFMKSRKGVLVLILIAIMLGVLSPARGICDEGLAPAELPLRGGTWQFRNFTTNEMSWDSFRKAFVLQWYEYLNPITYILYGGGRGLAAGGNCFGLVLLLDHAASVQSLSTPYSGRIEQSLWENYPALTRDLRLDVNTYQWRQMSVEFLRKWVDSLVRSPRQIASQIARDAERGQLGMITINQGFSGHALVPYGVIGSGDNRTIYVYDPNRPRRGPGSGAGAYTQLEVSGENNWSFNMGSSTWTQRRGKLMYVPFNWNMGYRKLPTGIEDLLIIILGSGTKAEQIVDGSGKRLFTKPNPTSLADLDTSARGLGRDIARLVPIAQGVKTLKSAEIAKEFEPSDRLVREMITTYSNHFSQDGEVYVVLNKSLRNLTIQTASLGKGKDVKMAIGNRNEMFEIDVSAVNKSHGIQPDINILSVANLSSGIKVHDRNAVASKATVSLGHVREREKELHLQKLQNLSVTKDGVELNLDSAKEMQVKSTVGGPDIMILKEKINSSGIKSSLGSKSIKFKTR